MSHDIHASWAATELARHFQSTPTDCFNAVPRAGLSVFAGREGRNAWPYADGVIVLQSPPNASFKIAVEFKRPNEGTHGLLTALGQSIAYINKGYNGAVLVLPNEYATHSDPGSYAAAVIDRAVGRPNIGVFTYLEPDTTLPSPFTGRLQCHRRLEVDTLPPAAPIALAGATETQWMHVREGSSTPSAFFRFLEISKALSIRPREPQVVIDQHLIDAIETTSPGADPLKYLSNSAGDDFRDKAWRHFWFRNVFTTEVMPIWRDTIPHYSVNDAATRITQADGISPMVFFAGRSSSIKTRLVAALNSGSITENAAWQEYVRNVRKRAHSYREDIDSGLEHMGMLDSTGKPTELGYRFIDMCQRTNAPHAGIARAMLGAAMLKNGDMVSLLHYIHRLSETLFRANPLEFANGPRRTRLDQNAYRQWLENELANNLRVLHKVSARGGVSRKPLQGELTLLRKFDFISRFRIGIGLEINWPVIQEALSFPL